MIKAPYGTWRSAVPVDLVARGTVKLEAVCVDSGNVYWSECRPAENGRTTVVTRKATGGQPEDVIAGPFDVRSRVHEYGGGSFTVRADTVYFTNSSDQRVHIQRHGHAPLPVTPDTEARCRYGDFDVDEGRGRLYCVQESHDGCTVRNSLVAIEIAVGRAEVIASGHDFFSAPRLSPDRAQLAWLSWDHPDMPWDTSSLWIADINQNGTLSGVRKVAGGNRESVLQPKWSPSGVLHFLSDRSGWWNVYRAGGDGVECTSPLPADMGVPPWRLGSSTYCILMDGRVVVCFRTTGGWELGIVGASSITRVPSGYTHFESIQQCGDGIACIAGSFTEAKRVVHIDLDTGRELTLRTSSTEWEDPGILSQPEAITFPTADDSQAHAFYYSPTHPSNVGPDDELPPLIVRCHGGPTSAATTALDPMVQYWTSRGFAVVDVDYRGSSGYGRTYREALYGQWGVLDVEDCVSAARYLTDNGPCDPDRILVQGSSAGGFTALSVLASHSGFAAGASVYGISDLLALRARTHKYESRYLDRLLGDFSLTADVYRARSPIHQAAKLDCPVVFFHGTEDVVVRPDQSELMYRALSALGRPVACLFLRGEGHGFRAADNVKAMVEAQLCFWCTVLGIQRSDLTAVLPIDNWPRPAQT